MSTTGDALPGDGRAARILAIGLAPVISVGILFRFYALDHLPGLNGDEAYLGTKVMMTLRGAAIAWRTGSGLLPEPLSFLVSAVLHAVAGVSVWTLRLPTAITGVLAIVAVAGLAHRIGGRWLALAAAALAAALPTHIAYSRFFWEPSQSPLACALWLWAAHARRPWLVVAGGAFALLAHPTNLFLLPLVVEPLLPSLGGAYRRWPPARRALAVGAAGAVMALLAVAFRPAVVRAAGNLFDVDAWRAFWTLYPGVVDGSTILLYIVGPLPETTWVLHRLGFCILFLLPVVASLAVDRERLGRPVIALCVALLAFFVVGGPQAVAPASERYALWMTVPHCVLAGSGWRHLAERTSRTWLLPASVLLTGALLLPTFSVQYFARLRAENSVTEATFATGDIEPKVRALAWIEAQRDPSRTTRIYAEDWWTYWAMKYLALDAAIPYEIAPLREDRRWLLPDDATLPPRAPETTQVFRVGYPDGRMERAIISRSPGTDRAEIRGYGGKVVLLVFVAP